MRAATMDPYRTAPRLRPRLDFGDSGRATRRMATGVAFIALTIAIVAAWAHGGGGIHGSVLLPGFVGLTLIVHARWGAIELDRNRGVLAITRRGLWQRRIEVKLRDLQSVEVVPTSFRETDPDYILNLTVADGRAIPLLRAAKMASLEPDRAAIAAFLVEHGLLWGAAGASAARAVAVPLAAERVEATDPQRDADDSNDLDELEGGPPYEAKR
jgi:hypothetical protein